MPADIGREDGLIRLIIAWSGVQIPLGPPSLQTSVVRYPNPQIRPNLGLADILEDNASPAKMDAGHGFIKKAAVSPLPLALSRRMRPVAERLVVRPAAATQRQPISNLVSLSIGGNNRDASAHVNRAAYLFLGVLD